jgi:hypothetical protein
MTALSYRPLLWRGSHPSDLVTPERSIDVPSVLTLSLQRSVLRVCLFQYRDIAVSILPTR